MCFTTVVLHNKTNHEDQAHSTFSLLGQGGTECKELITSQAHANPESTGKQIYSNGSEVLDTDQPGISPCSSPCRINIKNRTNSWWDQHLEEEARLSLCFDTPPCWEKLVFLTSFCGWEGGFGIQNQFTLWRKHLKKKRKSGPEDVFYLKENQQHNVFLREHCLGSILSGWLGKADFWTPTLEGDSEIKCALRSYRIFRFAAHFAEY